MKNFNTKGFLNFLLLIIIFGGVFFVPEILIGIKIENFNISLALMIAGLSYLVLAVAVNIIVSFVSRENFKQSKINEIFESIQQEREGLSDFGQIYRKMRILLVASYSYIFLVFAAAGLSVVGAFGVCGEELRVPVLMLLCLLQFFIFRTCIPQNPLSGAPSGLVLNAQQYPNVNRVVNAVAKTFNITKKINIYMDFVNNISISEGFGGFNIIIGKDILSVLSEKEFESVMIHEFAHAQHGDLKMGKFLYLLEGFGGKNVGALLFGGALSAAVLTHTEKMSLVIAKRKEELADKKVKDAGVAVDFINATAKLTMLEYYALSLRQYNVFQKEDYYQSYAQNLLDDFLAAYQDKSELWQAMCKRELPSRIDTHPACSERMKNLGIEDFVIDFSNASEQFCQEGAQIHKTINELSGIEKTAWADARKTNYLAFLEQVKEYEQSGKGELKQVSRAYFELCDYQKCLEILETILSSNPSDSYALCQKGLILCNAGDNSGIECLKQAIDKNINLCESGMQVLSSYIRRSGSVELRDSLRSWGEKKAEDYYSVAKFISFGSSKGLKPHNLSKTDLQQIEDELKRFNVLSCFIVASDASKLANHNFIFVETAELPNTNIYENAMQSIGDFLGGLDQSFVLINTYQNFKLWKKASKVSGSLIFKDCKSRLSKSKASSQASSRGKKFDKGLAMLVVILAVFLLSVALIVTGGILSEFAYQNLSLPFFISAVPILLAAFVLFVIESIKEGKKVRAFLNGKNQREIITIKGNYDQALKTRVEAYLLAMQFRKITIDGKEGFYLPKAENGRFILINQEAENIVVEAFIVAKNNVNAFEGGIYGMFQWPVRRFVRKHLRVVLDILEAPPSIII